MNRKFNIRKIFQMYSGLRKEIYILCFGRFVTALGSLIWPMLTFILKNKIGLNAEEVALLFLIFGIIQLPVGLLGGKITDRYNKRNIILLFDLLSVTIYVITSMLPLSIGSMCFFFIGSLLQNLEWPAYDALIAELTSDHDRGKAYSLQYLANNLGVVFAPTLGGILFNNYLWLSFLISGIAILTSTILIFFFIPKDMKKEKNTNCYEMCETGNLFEMLKTRKILLIYITITCILAILYAQYTYLLPIQMDEIFLAQGALLFGMLNSINGAVVIIFTPVLTQITLHWNDLERIVLGIFLEIAGLCSYFFFTDQIIYYIIAMIVFTLGEILISLGNSPYLSKRVPTSHRGRFMSVKNICTTISSSVGNTVVGKIVVLYSFKEGWIFVFGIGFILIILLMFYRKIDKKRFALLYH